MTVEFDGQICFVFCTVEVPVEAMNLLLTTAAESFEDGGNAFRILDIDEAANVKINTTPSTAPVKALGTSFLNWSADDICTFWRANLRPASDEESPSFCGFTFAILDEQSVKEYESGKGPETTLFIGCEAPDFREEDEEAKLKTLRLTFEDASMQIVSFEMCTMCPSEVEKEDVLSIMPPAIVGGSLWGMRMQKRMGIKQAEEAGWLDA